MAKTIHFNTGRMYTRFGQRITATHYDDGQVTFWDHDRHIDGQFALDDWTPFEAHVVRKMYDEGLYVHTVKSFEDGMQRGGCNNKYEGK